MHWKPGGISQSEFQKEVVDRAHRVFDANRPDPNMATDQDVPHPVEPEGAQKSAMVKYAEVDAKPTRKMLRVLKEADIHYTSSRNGNTTLVERLRENPFDVLILVLGKCDDDWLDKRTNELLEVELTLKEQSPLRAYYFTEETAPAPPHCSPSTLEIDGPGELDDLVQAIRGGGG